MRVSGISLNATKLIISQGATAELSATISPEDAYDKAITWSSSDTSIATVNDSGLVTGVNVGAAIITVKARDGGLTATCLVNVKSNTIAVTGVSLNVEQLNLVEGESETLVATVTPENATNKAVEWSSDNKSVATVDQNGVVKAVAPGEAFITVRTSDGGFEASIEVFVEEKPPVVIPVTGVEIASSTGLSMVPAGAKLPLSVTFSPEDTTQKGLIWTSSDEEVATVADGIVNGIKPGTATITATSTANNEVKDTFLVTVEQVEVPLESVAIYLQGVETSETTMYEDDIIQLASVLTPSNTTQYGIRWSSNNEAVASVDNTGKVTAHKAGTALITLQPTDNSSVTPASIVITVTKRPIPIVSITVSAENDAKHIYVGNTLQMSATLDPVDTTDTGVVWSSLDPDYATINNAGLVTAVAEGEVTIRCASINTPSVYGEYTFNVYETKGENKNIDVTSFSGPSSIEQSFRNNIADLDPVSTIKTKGANPATREEDTFFENEDGGYDVYKVGNANPFKLSFSAAGVDEDLDDVVIANLELKASLYLKNGESYGTQNVLDQYADTNDSFTSFQFNSDAAGKTFKLRVEPDASKYASVSKNCYFEHTFRVIDGGYNVYNWNDLSKMDNRADNFYQENAAVNAQNVMILQKDLTLKQSDLPSSMKWTSDKAQEYINTNPSDWQTFMDKIIYDEDQEIYFTYEVEVDDGIYENRLITTKKEAKDVFVDSPIDNVDVLVHRISSSSGTFKFEGNYFNLDYSHLKPVVKFYDKALLSDYASSEGGHSTFFGRDVTQQCTGKYSYKNLSCKGNGTRSAHDISPAGGLIMFKAQYAEFRASNVLAYSTFTTFQSEGVSPTVRGSMILDRVKAFDSYNIMFYNYGSDIQISNALAMRAGGAILMNDEVFAAEYTYLFRTAHTDVINSHFESWVAGTEAWYATKTGASGMVNALKSIGGSSGFIGSHKASFGTHNTFVEKKTVGEEQVDYVNLIAINACGKALLSNSVSAGTQLTGTITFDSAPVLDMAEPYPTSGITDLAYYRQAIGKGYFFKGSRGGSGALSSTTDFSEGVHYQTGLSSINPAFAYDFVTFSAAETAIGQLKNSGAPVAEAAGEQLENAFDAFYSSEFMASFIFPDAALYPFAVVFGCGNYQI